MRTINSILETIISDVASLTRSLGYVFWALYFIEILFNVDLNPAFPLQEEWLIVGGAVLFVISMLLKIWLLRDRK
jgi:hypothetical protein